MDPERPRVFEHGGSNKGLFHGEAAVIRADRSVDILRKCVALYTVMPDKPQLRIEASGGPPGHQAQLVSLVDDPFLFLQQTTHVIDFWISSRRGYHAE
jgi:hypothetical protein